MAQALKVNQPFTVGKPRQQVHKVAGYVVSAVRRQKVMNTPVQLT